MPTQTSYDLPRFDRTNERPHVMGILNVTPDSFSDGGKHAVAETALAHARQMIAEGADILDVGGESTRPGSEPVPLDVEWARLEPILDEVIAMGTPVSIDTYKAEIARRACAAGAVIVNDVWGLQKDPAMADCVAEAGVHVVMMHNRTGVDPEIDILADIDRFFEASMKLADRAGIAKDKQILDPGFGFGKTIDQNFRILNRFDTLAKHGLPLLAGASRKRMIGAVLNAEMEDRLFGSMAVHLTAMLKGAAIVRAHDVRPHVHCARMLEATRLERNPT
ncbi:dihydropteroate synthase [Roseibium sediminicola]|uniref:Dihydropteroate synthase n=1 Tax=Roseibium sediminicola TaxID=2933272 RepID=A0ABT0GSJ0_9HYPH|nr:dihydropteroate synthase [Roseibium sp. CAU 1639]MCK7612404.1 dihydropteroate synthase [Roseibium sp. CAU 1639]